MATKDSSNLFSTSTIWNRRSGHDTLGARVYNGLVVGYVFAGFILAALMSTLTTGVDLSNGWVAVGFIVGYLAVSFTGILLVTRNHSAGLSTVGFGLVASAVGLLLGPCLAHYTGESILTALAVTGLITLMTGLIGISIPKSLGHWAGWLSVGLVVVLCGTIGLQLLSLFMSVAPVLSVWGWLVVAFFSALLVFDFNRAMHLPKNAVNAIDAATGIFLDVANVFIWILRLLGGGGSNN